MAVRAGRLTVPVGGRCGAGKSIPGVLPLQRQAGTPKPSWTTPSFLEAATSGKVGTHATTEAAPAELRERAVAMVFELRAASGSSRGTLASVGRKLGVNPEILRNCVEKAEVTAGRGRAPRAMTRSA